MSLQSAFRNPANHRGRSLEGLSWPVSCPALLDEMGGVGRNGLYCDGSFKQVWWHDATLFEIYYFLTFIHTVQYNHTPFILHHSLRPVFLNPHRSARGASMGCRAEIRTRACLTASRRTTNWAAPHPDWAAPHPDWAAPHPNWAAPHPTWAAPHPWSLLGRTAPAALEGTAHLRATVKSGCW
jgi:hypothetical protein